MNIIGLTYIRYKRNFLAKTCVNTDVIGNSMTTVLTLN